MVLIGYHIEPDKYLKKCNYLKSFGGNIVQFFVSPTRKLNEYNDLKHYLNKNDIKTIVHASYTINCAMNWDSYSWHLKQFINEIEIASYIGAKYIVIHIGKQLQLSEKEALNNMYLSLLYVHNETEKHSNVKILIETSSGQGSEMCYKLEDLANLYRKFNLHKNDKIQKRFGICLDTCHVFSAGYNLKNKIARKMFFDKFDNLIGLNNIKLIHMNDSKVKLGTKIDRHENIGTGYIGKKALLIIAKIFIKLNVPIILETPYKNINKDLQIILLK
jgi:deoxyribonuclease IV